MTIDSISSIGSYGAVTNNGAEIKDLEKQITKLQNEISDLQGNKNIDETIKNQQLAVYQKQMLSLQVEVQNLRNAKSEQTEPASKTDGAIEASLGQYINAERTGVGQYVDEEA